MFVPSITLCSQFNITNMLIYCNVNCQLPCNIEYLNILNTKYMLLMRNCIRLNFGVNESELIKVGQGSQYSYKLLFYLPLTPTSTMC